MLTFVINCNHKLRDPPFFSSFESHWIKFWSISAYEQLFTELYCVLGQLPKSVLNWNGWRLTSWSRKFYPRSCMFMPRSPEEQNQSLRIPAVETEVGRHFCKPIRTNAMCPTKPVPQWQCKSNWTNIKLENLCSRNWRCWGAFLQAQKYSRTKCDCGNARSTDLTWCTESQSKQAQQKQFTVQNA